MVLVRGCVLAGTALRTRIASARPTATQQPVRCVAITRSAGCERPETVGSELGRFYGIDRDSSDKSGRFGVSDAHASLWWRV